MASPITSRSIEGPTGPIAQKRPAASLASAAGRSCADEHVTVARSELEQLREEARKARQITTDLLFSIRFDNACARGIRREDERELWREAVREHGQAARDGLELRYGAAA